MFEYKGTANEIMEEISWLEDDIVCCESVMNDPDAAYSEKLECQIRMIADRGDIAGLKARLELFSMR